MDRGPKARAGGVVVKGFEELLPRFSVESRVGTGVDQEACAASLVNWGEGVKRNVHLIMRRIWDTPRSGVQSFLSVETQISPVVGFTFGCQILVINVPTHGRAHV